MRPNAASDPENDARLRTRNVLPLERALGIRREHNCAAYARALTLRSTALNREGLEIPCDAVFDAVGNLSFLHIRRALTARGAFGSSVGLLNFAMVPLTARSRGRRVLFGVPAFSQPNVRFIAGLMACGAYRPIIDRVYPLEQVVEANRYVETERKTGNVVLAIA